MALKDKFASSIAARTGLTPFQAASALAHSVELIKGKVPPQIGVALDSLMASDNGVDPAQFLVPIAARAVERLPQGPLRVAAAAAVAVAESPTRWARVKAFLKRAYEALK